MTSTPRTQQARRLLPDVEVWAAAHTNARNEKVVAQELERLHVPVFLPLHKKRRTYGARIRESWLPLFPGYVFYDSEAIDRRDVYDTKRVANILVPDRPALLKADLENLALALARQPEIRPVTKLLPGTRVRVLKGALAGVEGTLVRVEKRTILVIMVSFVNFGAEVSIDEAYVEPIE
jgi:transcriptional antiterminator RfaH